MSRCNTCGSKNCCACKHGAQRCECAKCAADAAQEQNEGLQAEVADLREKLEEIEKLYGQRIEALEKTRCSHVANDTGAGCVTCGEWLK